MSIFSKRFKEERKRKGLTQQQLAEKFHTDKSSISKYENDHSMPELPILQEYAKFFGVSIDYLLGNTDERSPADKIKKAISDDPELLEFWEELKDREDLQLMFKQTRDLSPETIQQIINIIKTFEKEQDDANGG